MPEWIFPVADNMRRLYDCLYIDLYAQARFWKRFNVTLRHCNVLFFWSSSPISRHSDYSGFPLTVPEAQNCARRNQQLGKRLM